MPAQTTDTQSALDAEYEKLPHKPTRTIPTDRPRLLGSLDELKAMAQARPEAYTRMSEVARGKECEDKDQIPSMVLVATIEGDEDIARAAVRRTDKYIQGKVRVGHETFAHDLAMCALVYDLCRSAWSDSEVEAFHQYMNETVDRNVNSETHTFHNGYYGYKYWGEGMAAYATMYENPRAPDILATLHHDVQTRANPTWDLAGDGGGFGEGYYLHYFLYEWLIFCETARRLEGIDYYEQAPGFFRNRAVAGMFEMWPTIREHGSRKPIFMGDSGSRNFNHTRDKMLAARRILVNHFRDDPDHQAVHTFNELTPRVAVESTAYKDFLWRDETVAKGDLDNFKLSHYSAGPGFVYARSSWDEDATHFFFKCGDRFTAHQHLDVGHFLIFKNEELVGDAGHYAGWVTPHIVNFYLRSIAHNTMLVYDPDEKFEGIRKAEPNEQANDGGQNFPWVHIHHNGGATDVPHWNEHRDLFHIAEMLAVEEHGEYLYMAGDCTRAYDRSKLDLWTRQIVYLRPGTFVIFDRVKSTHPDFQKTWILQTAKTPEQKGQRLVVTHGNGRLFVQTLLPAAAAVSLHSGDDMYRYHGHEFLPDYSTGPAPECRVEVSPAEPAAFDLFCHVLTTSDASVDETPAATAEVGEDKVTVRVGSAQIEFEIDRVGVKVGL